MKNAKLEEYRDAVSAIVHGNNHAVLTDPNWNDKQKAGTALLMAVASTAFAASLMAKTEPRLKNAPFEAQLDDMLDLVREVLVKKEKPNLQVVTKL